MFECYLANEEKMAVPTSSSTGYFQRAHSTRAPLEFSFTFDSPQAVFRPSENFKGPSKSFVPALMCIYCGGLYSREIVLNANQGSHNFICIHCTKRIEAEVEETNRCQGSTDVNDRPPTKSASLNANAEPNCYRKLLAEIKNSIELLKKMLVEGDTDCRTQLASLTNEIESIKQKQKQTENSPVVSTAQVSSPVKCGSAVGKSKDVHCNPESCPVRFRNKPLSKNRIDRTNRHRKVVVPDRPRKKYVHIVGGSKVGELECLLNPLLNGDRRCRFFVYRRAAFRDIVDKVRNRVHLHNPRTNEQLIALYVGPYDVFPSSSNTDFKGIWSRIERTLDALANDCQRRGVSLIIYTSPQVVDGAESHCQKAWEYINGALHRKFSGTQVAVRNFSVTQIINCSSQLNETPQN